MTPLRQALQDYLRIRRQLGFELKATERRLNHFVEFLEQAGAERITIELAVMWARMPVDAHPHWWKRRLGFVRGFARHLATIDPSTQVPPTNLLPARRPRIAPYIYSPAEIAALMRATETLTPALHAITFKTLIGLIATTGLRAGEALALDCHDVDLEDGALHVRARKHKQREVPLHQTTMVALREYARRRDQRWPDPVAPAFFVGKRGGRLASIIFYRTFPALIRQAGLDGKGMRARPRAHDLRHTFAVRTLVDWYRAGEDVDRRMPELSTFLGHSDPASSYWYLEAVPELMALISARLEQLPEVFA